MAQPDTTKCGHTRRGFLLGAGVGAAAASLAWYGGPRLAEPPRVAARSPEVHRPEFAMPGPFPGRVVEVKHPAAVRGPGAVDSDAVRPMMERGMCELTGADDAAEAWKRFFGPGDAVGVKVNPEGCRNGSEPGTPVISSPAVILEVIRGLKGAGVRPADIILFERYADKFRRAGYEELLREPGAAGVRWFAASAYYSPTQLDIEGYDHRRDADPHVVGYDPDEFITLPFCSQHHHPKDDRRFRSHVSAVVSRMVNKIVTIPVLKDHRSAGVPWR